MLVIAWHLAKVILTGLSAANPGALVGVGAMNVTGALAGKAATQVINGGKNFLKWVNEEIENSALKQQITDAFVAAHKQAQDDDVKAVVKPLVK